MIFFKCFSIWGELVSTSSCDLERIWILVRSIYCMVAWRVVADEDEIAELEKVELTETHLDWLYFFDLYCFLKKVVFDTLTELEYNLCVK
jgi:hypothetical protein